MTMRIATPPGPRLAERESASAGDERERPHREALAAALAIVRRQLERGGKKPLGAAVESRIEPPATSALGHIVRSFALTPFETATLVLTAGIELEPTIAKACATAHGDPARPWPTLGLAIAMLEGAHWDALAPDRPLRRDRLVVLGDGEVLTQRSLRIDERVLHALMGVEMLEPRIARRVQPIEAGHSLARSHERIVDEVCALLRSERAPLVQLVADLPNAALMVAARAGARFGLTSLRLQAAEVPVDALERDELVHLLEREARLAPLALVLDLDAGRERATERAALELAARLQAPLVLVGREAAPVFERAVARVRVPDPGFAENLGLWREAVADAAIDDAELGKLVAQFRLDAGSIRGAAAQLAVRKVAEPVATSLWRACREQARPRLEDLAQRVIPQHGFERLVLPESQHRTLRALVGQVRNKARVHYDWGLSEHGERGHGTSAIFAGPSGVGKTMGAEAIACELGLDLFRIDLSAVVSKYIGETEENLRRVFDAAESGGAILLFDEADALFGKRTEVKDSHDRHANIEVSYLLQRMEAYGGLSILTTNLRKSIDDAFLRRVQFVVEFPFPDAELRERIWRGMFPSGVPLAELDFARLAQLSVTGGNIRSIARNAAYLAADAGVAVDMQRVLEAARLEYAKLARSLPPHEIRGWMP